MVIKGTINKVYDKILKEYHKNDVELVSLLMDIKPVDLTIEESTILYSKLRKEVDGDIVIRITDNEVYNIADETIIKKPYWIRSVGDLYE